MKYIFKVDFGDRPKSTLYQGSLYHIKELTLYWGPKYKDKERGKSVPRDFWLNRKSTLYWETLNQGFTVCNNTDDMFGKNRLAHLTL